MEKELPLSTSKTAGAIVGLAAGATIAYLYLTDLLDRTSMPTGSRVATLMLGALLGAAIGAFIGTADRRPR